MMKRKPDIGIIITAIMFGAALAIMIAALLCMAADVDIWHRLIPPAILLTIVTGLMFIVSLALHFYNTKTAKTDLTELPENPNKDNRRTKIAHGFGIAALVCFYIALICAAASRLCVGLADALTKLFAAIAALAACAFAIISVVLSKRSTAEKISLLSLISLPIALAIACIVMVAVFAAIMFYLMLISWAEWGLI